MCDKNSRKLILLDEQHICWFKPKLFKQNKFSWIKICSLAVQENQTPNSSRVKFILRNISFISKSSIFLYHAHAEK